MPFCHNCGQKLPDGAKFCTECGTPTAAPVPQPVPEQPVYEAPVYEEPVYETPAVEAPAYEAPAVEAPAYEAPVYEEPVYETPAPQPEPEAPAFEQPLYKAPAYEQPVYEAPAYEQPVYEAPAYEQPVYEPAPVTPAPASNGYFTPAPRAGAKPPKAPNAPAAQHVPAAQKKRNMLILAIAAGVVLVAIIAVVLLLTLGGKNKGNDAPEAPKSSLVGSKADSGKTSGKGGGKAAGKDTAPAEDETLDIAETRPEETAEDEAESIDEEDAYLQEQSTLLAIYQIMLEACADETTDDFAAANNNGYVWEYDDDGYPEMTFLCSFDGISLSAIIARRTDDATNPMMIEEKLWNEMPDNAVNAIYSGVLDGEPTLYLEATYMEDGFEIGRSYVYSLANTTIEKLYELEWTCYEDDTLNTCCVMDADGNVLSTDDEDHFLSIYNCVGYYEASYPYMDGYGRLFEDMLTAEALELIYG